MGSYIILIIVIFIFGNFHCTYPKNDNAGSFRDEIAIGGHQGSAGIHAKLTEKGVDCVNKLVSDLFYDVLSQLTIAESNTNLPYRGTAKITNLRVSRVKPAQEYILKLTGPNLAFWKAKDFDVVIKGHAKSRVMNYRDQGDFTIKLEGVTFMVNVQVSNYFGYPRLDVQDCKTKITFVDMEMRGMEYKGTV